MIKSRVRNSTCNTVRKSVRVQPYGTTKNSEIVPDGYCSLLDDSNIVLVDDSGNILIAPCI